MTDLFKNIWRLWYMPNFSFRRTAWARLMAVAIALFSAADARAQDTWSGRDKRLHFGISAMAGVGSAVLFPDRGQDCFGGPWAVCQWGIAMVPGLAKELMDSSEEGNKFSGKDMVANALGAALGVAGGNWIVMRRNGTTMIAYRSTF